MIKQADGWHERVVALNAAGNLVFGSSAHPVPNFDRVLPKDVRAAPIGSIYEWRKDNIAFEIGRRVRDNGAALIIDYGHSQSDVGDTLQAVRQHAFADALSAPGSVDITAHVDFEASRRGGRKHGRGRAWPDRPERFPAASRHRGACRRLEGGGVAGKESRDRGRDRAADTRRADRHGRLFKAMGLADPKLGPLPGFRSE